MEETIDSAQKDRQTPVSAWEKNLSPGNLLDTAISYFGAHGGEMAKAFRRFAKDNPVPVALMGVGVAWMLLTPKSANDLERDGYVSGRDDQEDATEEYAGIRSTRAQSQTEPLTRGLKAMAQEQPFLLAAIGIAIGAAIGAALPESESEHRWLGPARDRTLSKIKEEGEHAYEQVRGATQRAVEGVKQAVWDVTTGRKN